MLRLASALCVILLAGCSPTASSPRPASKDPLTGARTRAVRYLIAQQRRDGTWSSDQYAPFKDSTALTPLVLLALKDTEAASWPGYRRGLISLSTLVKEDGSIHEGLLGLSYPVYTSSLAVLLLDAPEFARERAAWLAYLRQRQLTEELGWQPADKPYGGWGYAIALPRKPAPGALTSPVEANLSATVFALEAMRAAGVPENDPAIKKALVFVERCQNFKAKDADPAFDDGGFHFIYDDGARNKAGPAGRDQAGRERFRSYGSATADGWRALRACGLPVDHPRCRAAHAWLSKHFRPGIHPGNYPEARAGLQPGVYFYYAAALARCGPDKPEELVADLLKRQRPDGSWCNEAGAQREDDPLVATALALQALNRCR
ncbi:MAG: prenyltransferase/squalene oxidase repeat-containing protein [Gemmataceae bacterium]